MRPATAALLLALLALLASNTAAQDLDDLSLGTWLTGPDLDRGDLRGRVVVVELWGYR